MIFKKPLAFEFMLSCCTVPFCLKTQLLAPENMCVQTQPGARTLYLCSWKQVHEAHSGKLGSATLVLFTPSFSKVLLVLQMLNKMAFYWHLSMMGHRRM